jgi:hypothetical protein
MAADSVIRLSDVRKIYIEPMQNSLDQYLRSAISRRFHTNIEVVLKKEDADAVMSSANQGAQQVERATVNLTDRSGQHLLWTGTAGDRSVKKLGIKHGGLPQVADSLIAQLKKAMQQ